MNRIAPPLVILAVFAVFMFIIPDAHAISMQIVTNTGAAWLVEDENTYDDGSPSNAPDVNFIFANQTAIKGLGIGAKIVTLDFDTATLIHGEEQVGIERAVRPVNNINDDTRFAALLNIDDDVIRYLIELNKEYVWGDTTGLESLPTEIDENNILSYNNEHAFGVADPNPNVLWITRHSPASEETIAELLTFQVRFDEPVTGVNQNDFTISRGSINGVSGLGNTYLVTVDVTTTGVYNLDLVSNPTITDSDGNTLVNTAPVHADELYTATLRTISDPIPVNTTPELLSILRHDPIEENTSASELTYEIVFNKPVTGVNATDFKLFQNIPANIPQANNFNLNIDNNDPSSITYSGGNYYIIDSTDNIVYAYDSNWSTDSSSSFNLTTANIDPYGITTKDGKLYVVDHVDNRVYIYNPDGTNASPSSFSLSSTVADAYGITYTGSKFYVVDQVDKKIYAYTATGGRSSTFDFELTSNNADPYGISYGNGKLYVVDKNDARVYAYNPNGMYSPSDDFDIDPSNSDPQGITYYDGKFLIINNANGKIYEYNVYEEDIDVNSSPLSEEITLDVDNTQPNGVSYYNSRFYVVDEYDNQVYAYNKDFTRYTSGDFNLDTDNTNPVGITYYGSKFWILDDDDDKVYAYTTSGARSTSSDFNLDADNDDSRAGIIYYSSKFWIPDEFDHKVYAYTTGGARSATHDFNLLSDGNWSPKGIAYNAGIFYVIDSNKVYAYGAVYGNYLTSDDFNLHWDNYDPRGSFAFYDKKFYITNYNTEKIFTYHIHEDNLNNDITRFYDKEFDLHMNSTEPRAITYDNGKFYIIDSTDKKVYVYNGWDGTHTEWDDFNLDVDNAAPYGITPYNNKFYVTDHTDNKVYVYNSYGDRSPTDDFNLVAANANSYGITLYDNKFWITDSTDRKIYAYNTDGTPSTVDDFVLPSVNSNPRGITFNDGKFYVLDGTDDKIYAYNSDGTPYITNDFKLTTGIDPYSVVFYDGKFYVTDRTKDKVFAYEQKQYNRLISESVEVIEINVISIEETELGIIYYLSINATNNKVFDLDLISAHGITDLDGIALLNITPSVSDETYIKGIINNNDNTAPELISIERHIPSENPTNITPVIYKVTFNEPVTGLDASDFVLSPSSTGGTGMITVSVEVPADRSGRPDCWMFSLRLTCTITLPDTARSIKWQADSIETDRDQCPSPGSVTIKLSGGGSKSSSLGNCRWSDTVNVWARSGVGSSWGGISGSPSTLSFTRTSASYEGIAAIASVEYAYTGVTLEDQPVNWTLEHASSLESIGNFSYLMTIVSTSDGTYNLDLKSSNGITDLANNALSNNVPTGSDHTFIIDSTHIDNIAPTVTSIEKIESQSNQRIQVFKVIFSEAVVNVDKSSFVLIGSGNAEVIDVDGSGTVYIVKAVVYSGNNFNLELSPTQTITDLAGNPLPNTSSTPIYDIAPDPTYSTDKPVGHGGNIAKTNNEITATGGGHYIVDLDYLDDVSNIKFTGTSTDATFNIVRIDEVSKSHGEVPRYSSTGMINYDEMDPNIDGLYMEFILPTSNSEIVVSAHSIVPVSHFFKITDLPDDTPWEIRQDGLPILRGVTDGNELILHEHEFPVINLDGTFEFILYPNSMIWTDDFSTIILDKYHDQEIHIDTTEDRIYIVHAYVNVPITGNITVTNMQLIGRDANVTNLPLNYLEGTYDEPIYIPVIPNYKGFSLMLDNVTASMEYKDVLNAPSVQIADPSERIEITRNYTNPSTYGESTTGTVAYYVATDDSVKMQIVMSIDGSLEIQNNYLGCTVRETDENTPWKIRDPLNAWAEVYVNGEQRMFNGTDRIFLGENEFPSTAQKLFNGTHTLEVIDDVNFNILSDTNLLPLDSSIEIPECTLESFQITSYELTDLDEGEEYKVKMRPRYSGHVPGVWSNEISIVTMSTGGSSTGPETASANIPSSDHDIRNLTLESNEPGTISVSWTAPVDVPDKDYRLQWAKYIDNYISFTEDNFFEGNAWPAPETFTLVRNTLFEYPTFLIVGAVQVDDLEPGDIVELFVYAQIYGGVDETYIAPSNVDILQETGWAKATVEIISASVSLD